MSRATDMQEGARRMSERCAAMIRGAAKAAAKDDDSMTAIVFESAAKACERASTDVLTEAERLSDPLQPTR